MSTSPALRAAARVVSSGMLRNTSRLTAGGLRQKPDRKSTRLNSSHSQISYAVFLFKKSTRLNSSHSQISYAVFCLKKKIVQDDSDGHAILYPHLRDFGIAANLRASRDRRGYHSLST